MDCVKLYIIRNFRNIYAKCVIWNRYDHIGACLLLLETQAPGRGCSEWLETPYSAPQPFKKQKKTSLQALKNFFKTKKEIHMQTLKIISMIYTAWVLIRFVWLDCKSGDASESVIYKIFSLLQSVVLAYIIIK